MVLWRGRPKVFIRPRTGPAKTLPWPRAAANLILVSTRHRQKPNAEDTRSLGRTGGLASRPELVRCRSTSDTQIFACTPPPSFRCAETSAGSTSNFFSCSAVPGNSTWRCDDGEPATRLQMCHRYPIVARDYHSGSHYRPGGPRSRSPFRPPASPSTSWAGRQMGNPS